MAAKPNEGPNPELDLLAELDNVCEQLEALCRNDGESMDPERLMKALDAQMVSIGPALENILKQIDADDGVANLNTVVEETCHELLCMAPQPFLVRSRYDSAAPTVALPRKLVQPLISKAICAAIEQLDADDAELLLQTDATPTQAVLQIGLTRDIANRAVVTRDWQRLEKLVVQLGGELDLETVGPPRMFLRLPLQQPAKT